MKAIQGIIWALLGESSQAIFVIKSTPHSHRSLRATPDLTSYQLQTGWVIFVKQ